MTGLSRTVTVFTRGKEVRVYDGPVETPPGWQRFNEVLVQRTRRRGRPERVPGRPSPEGAESE